MININFIIPPLFFNKDSTGFNEMLASELNAICRECNVNSSIIAEYPVEHADIYILPVQYREDVFSEWFKKCVETCVCYGGIVFICGKSASVEYRYILKYTGANYVALGEFDDTLRDVIFAYSHLNKDRLQENIQSVSGLAYLKSGQIIRTGKRSFDFTMDGLPFPSYEYLQDRRTYRICVMETSRSCHGKCNFCEGYLFRSFSEGNEYRVKSPQRVVDEIIYVTKKYSRHVFSFSDDNFLADGNLGKQRAIEIANLLIKSKVRARFTIECRADDIDEDIFKYLKQAGLIKVFVGIESGSQAVLDRYNKGTTVEDNHKAITTLKNLDIACHPGHILFDPKTSPRELLDSVIFFEKYIDYLFSFDEGDSDRTLYYPQGCGIVQDFWPNKSQDFYENIWYHGTQLTFEDMTTNRVYDRFIAKMKDDSRFKECNLLKRRILNLKEALYEEGYR